MEKTRLDLGNQPEIAPRDNGRDDGYHNHYSGRRSPWVVPAPA